MSVAVSSKSVWDEQVQIDLLQIPQTSAVLAGAGRAVKGKDARRQLRQADAAVGAGELLAVDTVDVGLLHLAKSWRA